MGRGGSYPDAPDFERLTEGTQLDAIAAARDIDYEGIPRIIHAYIQDGWPGPSVFFVEGDRLLDWESCLTIERAQSVARSYMDIPANPHYGAAT